MCGGPVLALDIGAGGAGARCVGMVEGIVPPQRGGAAAASSSSGGSGGGAGAAPAPQTVQARAAALLAGAAAVIEGQAVADFVQAVEEQRQRQGEGRSA